MVTRPLTSQHSSPAILVSSAWLTALLPSLPCALVFQLSPGPAATTQCSPSYAGWSTFVVKSYYTAVFLVIFVIPLGILICLYTHILVQLREYQACLS